MTGSRGIDICVVGTGRALLAAVCELAKHAAEHRADLDLAKSVTRALIDGALFAASGDEPTNDRPLSASRAAR